MKNFLIGLVVGIVLSGLTALILNLAVTGIVSAATRPAHSAAASEAAPTFGR